MAAKGNDTAEEHSVMVTNCAAEQLHQVQELVGMLTDAQYVHRPEGASSIAGHVRHCVDHYTAILAGIDSGTVEYDRRVRGTALEKDRSVALDRLGEVRSEVRGLAARPLDRPVEVISVVDSDGSLAATRSTAGRELLFVSHHTVHHIAVMVPMARTLGVRVPERFGYAPATLACLR
ncbi:DinB family protein [Streptomyces halobius]|uniref:DinB family protein n=1 Tax=Streptomyces halobius TaxID=2879846 RepID=A0ABY4LZ76_9ACTN|nr:DinB family protein [Streptomyces halobius]UQA90807.1 DinB family protein [Streptomyces halobius]